MRPKKQARATICARVADFRRRRALSTYSCAVERVMPRAAAIRASDFPAATSAIHSSSRLVRPSGRTMKSCGAPSARMRDKRYSHIRQRADFSGFVSLAATPATLGTQEGAFLAHPEPSDRPGPLHADATLSATNPTQFYDRLEKGLHLVRAGRRPGSFPDRAGGARALSGARLE
jgi:hypothetical protein